MSTHPYGFKSGRAVVPRIARAVPARAMSEDSGDDDFAEMASRRPTTKT